MGAQKNNLKMVLLSTNIIRFRRKIMFMGVYVFFDPYYLLSMLLSAFLFLFPAVLPCVCLQSEIVVFPGHTHFMGESSKFPKS